MLSRRAALALPMLALPSLARGQGAYPSRPIRIILPFPAGGAADAQTRAFGDALGVQFGQRVLVDNRPGAGGNLARKIHEG